jgi:hypothetical protein
VRACLTQSLQHLIIKSVDPAISPAY